MLAGHGERIEIVAIARVERGWKAARLVAEHKRAVGLHHAVESGLRGPRTPENELPGILSLQEGLPGRVDTQVKVRPVVEPGPLEVRGGQGKAQRPDEMKACPQADA